MKLWGKSLIDRGLLTKKVYADAFDLVDRSDFLPDRYKKYSDVDRPAPISSDQTQSAPHMDAIFVSYVEPKDDETVLEIGTGSGYLTTILSFLCKGVVSLDCSSELSKWARCNVMKYGRKNIEFIIGNINRICLKRRFNLIISAASFKSEPKFLEKMIEPDGRIIFPLGSFPPQQLVGYRNGNREELGAVSFVNIVD